MSDTGRARAKDHPPKVLSALYSLTRDKDEECFDIQSIIEKDKTLSENFSRYCLEEFKKLGYVRIMFLGDDSDGVECFYDEDPNIGVGHSQRYWKITPEGIAAHEAGFGTGGLSIDHAGEPTLNLTIVTCLLYFYCSVNQITEFSADEVSFLFVTHELKNNTRVLLDFLETMGVLAGSGLITRRFAFTDKARAIVSASVRSGPGSVS